MSENYDVIVVGAGIGGLMAAAGLVQEGKKVLVLEKANFIGGKYTELDYKGYKVTTGAWSNIGKHGHIGRFCDEVGAQVEYITLNQIKKERGTPGSLGKIRYKNGQEFITTSTLTTPFPETEAQELAKLMIGLYAKEVKGIDRSKNISVRQYANYFTKSDKIMKLLDSVVGTAAGLNIDTLPTSEFRIIVNDGFNLSSGQFGFPKGGIKSLIDALEKVITEKGGKIQIKSCVKKIYIDGNSATGVELFNGDSIYSDIIINNAGPKNLLKLCDRNKFPSSFLKKVDSLIPVEALAIICGLNKPISEDVPMILTPDCERIVGIFEPTFFDPSLAPLGKSMIDIFAPLKSKNIKKEIEITISDLQELYPGILDSSNLDFQQNMVFTGDFPAAEGGQTFGQTGDDRIDPKLPIDNLYLVGAEATGSGVAADLIPLGVRRALNYILNTEKWLKVTI